MDLSNTAKRLLKQKYGFRNDDAYDGGATDFESVLKYETKELGNIDIFGTCKELYGIDYNIDNIDNCIENIMEFFDRHFGTRDLGAKWLTTKTVVREYYDGNNDNISKLQIPEDALIASDLGKDGILFVSKSKFNII